MEYNDLKNAYDSLKRENLELKKRNHMLQKLLEGLPVILTRLDDEGNTIESLGAGLQELGYANNQLEGQNIFTAYPDAINIKNVIENKKELSFVGTAYNNGIIRHYKNFFFSDPEDGGTIGFSIDITDQINVQEKLKVQESFIKHVVSETPDIIYVYDLDEQKNLFINREISDVLGYSNEELLSMGASVYQQIIHPDDVYKFKQRNDAIRGYKDEEVHLMEVRAINKERKWRWLEARSTPFKRSSDGKLQQFIAIVRDVTEIKEASQKLQERELFIKQVTEATPDIIYVYDLKLQQYIYFNRQFSEFLGYEESEFKASGNAIHQSVFHPDDRHIWQQRYERYETATDHELIEDEVRVKHANGHFIWLFTSAKVFKRNDDGSVWQVLGTARDITSKKRSENILIETNKELFDTQQTLQKLFNELEERVQQRTLDIEKQREHLYSVFMQAPAGMAFLKGPDHIYELANERYHRIVGKKDLLGKPGRQAIPELEAQGIWELVDKVFQTEEPYFANEMPLILHKGDEEKPEETFINFKIIPVHDINKQVDGVLVHALDITEQVAAHLESKRSSKRLKAVFESIPLMAWTALPDGNINYFNQGWYNYTGQSHEEALGFGWKNVFHPEDLVETIYLWKKTIQKEAVFETQARFKKQDTGEYRWHIIRAVPLKDESDEIVLYVGTCTDIHNQKETEEKFRFLSEFVPQLFWTTGPDGAADYFNQRWYDYSGLTFEQSKDWGWASILHPDDIAKATEVWTSSIKFGTNYQTEFRIIRAADGAARWHLVRAIPLHNKEGEVIKWFGTCTDIHDNILARQELQERNLSLSIINSIGKKISGELDITKLVQEVTDATTQLSGAEFGAFFYNVIDSKGEFLTLYTVSGVPKEKFANFPLPRNTAVFSPTFHNKGSIRVDDITLDPRYGKNAPHKGMPEGHLPVKSYMAVSVVSRSGEVLGGLLFGHSRPGIFTEQAEALVEGIASQTAIAIDNSRLFEKQNVTLDYLAVTKEQLSEINAEVIKKNEELVKINNDLDSFIYTASHDLKSPISNLEGLLNALMGVKVQEEEEVKPLLKMMQISVERFKNTIHELTEISKIQKLSEEDVEEVDLKILLEEVKFSMSDFINQNNAIIEHDFKVPSLQFSSKNLRSILYNLINNAIKYRSEDRTPVVRIMTEDDGNFIKLIVSDNGLGISKNNKHKVFSMFKRLHDHVEGSGVGLYIVKRVVENTGGKIEIESDIGRGSTFTIYFKK